VHQVHGVVLHDKHIGISEYRETPAKTSFHNVPVFAFEGRSNMEF